MAKKRSFYENEYTKQLEEAVFDQRGYDEKKAHHKKKVVAENRRQRGLVRVFYALCLLGFLILAKHLLDLDPNNAAPLVMFLCFAAGIFGFVRWINK